MLHLISRIDCLEASHDASSSAVSLAPISRWLTTSTVDLRGSFGPEELSAACSSTHAGVLRRLTLRNNHVCKDLAECGGHDVLFGLRELVLNNVPLVGSLDGVASRLVVSSDTTTGQRRRHINESDLQTLFVRCNREMRELPLLMPVSLLRVTLRDTVLSSLEGLVRCRMLLELDISQNKHIMEIPASLALGEHMPYLRRVNASQTRVSNVSGLAECPSLETLILDSTPMLRSTPVVPALRELYLNYSGISDFSSIDNHAQLEVLEVSWSRDVTSVPCLPNIRVLRLEGCSLLMDLGMLHGNTSLERLHIEYCQHISSLPSLPSLRVLSATRTGLTSDAVEECFRGHHHIEEVYLRGCPAALRTPCVANALIRTD